MTLYLIYSNVHQSVLRIDTDRERAIQYAKQYTADTWYESYVVETNFTDWYECDDWFDDENVIAYFEK